jgi:hypothetical protein
MNLVAIRVTLWIASFTALGLAAVACRASWADARLDSQPMPAAVPTIAIARSDSLAHFASMVSEHDPFRLDRRPTTNPFHPELVGATSSPPPARQPRPPLALAGIVGGPPWEALVDGIPGHDASVLVRQGDVLSDLKVRSIDRDTIVLKSADTTWRLGMKHPWPR